MKKRVVAVLLSLTMCSAMVAETGAAAIAEPFAEVVTEDAFSDEVSDNADGQNENGEVQTEDPEGSDGGSITIEDPDSEDATGNGTSDNTDGEITDNNTGGSSDMEASPDGLDHLEEEFSDGLFSSGDNMTETEQQAPVLEEENTEAAAASFESVDEEAHKATLLYTRWKQFGKAWKLSKLPKGKTVQENTAPDTGDVQQPTDNTEATEQEIPDDTAVPEVPADVMTVPEVQGESVVQDTAVTKTVEVMPEETADEGTADFSDEAAVVPETIPAEPETVPETEIETQTEETPAETAGAAVEYYRKTMVEVTTVDSKGNQLAKGIYYFDGNGNMVTGRFLMRKGTAGYTESSDGEYYFMESYKTSVSNPDTAAGKNLTPYNSDFGQMKSNFWVGRDLNKKTQYRYFGDNGRYKKMPAGAYKIFNNKDALYFADANGYLVQSKMTKGADGYYYYTNKFGQVYTDRLIKIQGYRYYFTSSGKRATWKNRWVRLGANTKNRYYYFGSVAGRVQEKKGIQKVTVNGKFVGWFLFTSGGNNVQNYWSKDRYFLPDGRMASGVTKVGKYYYFFERSSTTKYRGNRYKGTWIKYNNKYYYAASNGVLASNGWRNIKGGRYYFQNCTAVTNKRVKDPSTNKWGWLDSRGRYSTEWIIMDDAKNRARYMDPSTGYVLKNTTKTIDGVNYRFDKYGNRVSDRTNEFRQSSYYLECDRVNGVMTIYTNSKKNVPIKTVRVSVGNPGTPTPLMTNERIDRADRWQLLMGPSWGQYGTHVRGGIYIHSVASGQRHGNNLPAGEYLKLGNPASHGCIRCCVADAKWIWENCNGSRIRIFDGKYNANETFKGPLGRNPLTPLRGSGTFDPTDPEYN
ncbi:MAG: L,D-transpeptidase family protein [Blautia sp.]|uniref:L,D-transpeptidase family protein n=1 Tax=Blautia sp. TaxID=1955243 RepID=UPI002A74F4D0|nr:L,D-transpeptidase family protein [Blautia sp.]MDY3015756.1 L,D-transpeptidase family protein [Blautia sp.]MED9883240.1 L,D-transpeptidase family protein [Blautia sp.]